MTPTLGDLYAYRIFPSKASVLYEMERRGSLATLGPEAFAANVNVRTIDTTSVLDVMRLVRKMLPDEPTPALDHAWRTRGLEAERADLLAFWDEERVKPDAAEKDRARVRPRQSEEMADLRAELRELKQLLMFSTSHPAARPPATDLTTWLDEQSGRSETATLRSATDNMSTYRK